MNERRGRPVELTPNETGGRFLGAPGLENTEYNEASRKREKGYRIARGPTGVWWLMYVAHLPDVDAAAFSVELDGTLTVSPHCGKSLPPAPAALVGAMIARALGDK